MKKLIVLLSLLTLLITSTTTSAENAPSGTTQTMLDQLLGRASKGQISGFDVFEIPFNAEFQVDVTPQRLEQTLYRCRISIRDLEHSQSSIKGLLRALQTVESRPASGTRDIRLGIVFYDVESVRLGSIYFDQFGKQGYINDVPVLLSGDLFSWILQLSEGCKTPMSTVEKRPP